MLNTVDIRDYGALANQDIDNYDAFVSADRAAKGDLCWCQRVSSQ